MRLTRIYVPASNGKLMAGVEAELPQTAGEHVTRVLRLRIGAAITLFDGLGGEWSAQITSIARTNVRARCIEHSAVERESPLTITLLQSLARGEKMDWVIQKATELGVARIIPLTAERSVVQIDDERAPRRLAHWQAVAASACEQSGRNRLPVISGPLAFAAACNADLPSARLVLDPEASRPLASALGDETQVAVLIGPEGGLTTTELDGAQHSGFVSVSLGPRVLRTETAAVAALTAIQLTAGDFGATGSIAIRS